MVYFLPNPNLVKSLVLSMWGEESHSFISLGGHNSVQVEDFWTSRYLKAINLNNFDHLGNHI